MMIGALVVEFGILVLYFATIYLAYKINKLDFLIYATIFAFIFENLNVVFFSQNIAGYFYSGGFLMNIFYVPLFIILAWGILLLGAYIVSLKLRMSKISRIFFIPLFVTLIDFVIEGVSVKLGYWIWLGAEGVGMFSSIVASNFVGWLAVSFGFILCYEYLNKKWFSVFLGYFIFLFVEAIFQTISIIFGFVGNENYISLGVIFLTFLFLWIYFSHKTRNLKKNKDEFKLDFRYAKYIVYMRSLFYFFTFFYFFKNGYYVYLIYDIVLFLAVFIETYFLLRMKGILNK